MENSGAFDQDSNIAGFVQERANVMWINIIRGLARCCHLGNTNLQFVDLIVGAGRPEFLEEFAHPCISHVPRFPKDAICGLMYH